MEEEPNRNFASVDYAEGFFHFDFPFKHSNAFNEWDLFFWKMKPLFSIVKKICEDMVKYVDEKLEAGTNTFVSKDVTITVPTSSDWIFNGGINAVNSNILARFSFYCWNHLQLRLWIG